MTAAPKPVLTGLTLAEAREVLAKAGQELGTVTVLPVRALVRGMVAYQAPASRANDASGNAVDVWVSSGPGPRDSPCVMLGSQNTCSSTWGG